MNVWIGFEDVIAFVVGLITLLLIGIFYLVLEELWDKRKERKVKSLLSQVGLGLPSLRSAVDEPTDLAVRLAVLMFRYFGRQKSPEDFIKQAKQVLDFVERAIPVLREGLVDTKQQKQPDENTSQAYG